MEFNVQKYVPQIVEHLEGSTITTDQDVIDYQNLKDIRSEAILRAKENIGRATVSARFLKMAHKAHELAMGVKGGNLWELADANHEVLLDILVAVVTYELKRVAIRGGRANVPRVEVWRSVKRLCSDLEWHHIRKGMFYSAMTDAGHECGKVKGVYVYKTRAKAVVDARPTLELELLPG